MSCIEETAPARPPDVCIEDTHPLTADFFDYLGIAQLAPPNSVRYIAEEIHIDWGDVLPVLSCIIQADGSTAVVRRRNGDVDGPPVSFELNYDWINNHDAPFRGRGMAWLAKFLRDSLAPPVRQADSPVSVPKDH